MEHLSSAPTRSEAPSPFHVDAEVDPLAFVLSGYSLHVGLGYKHMRLDLGTFAINVPKFVHGQDGFDSSIHGFGAKFQLFPFTEQRGFFFGADATVSRNLVERHGTDLADSQGQVAAGVHAGFRVALPLGFYATPWIGVSYTFDAKDVMLGGVTFKSNPVTIFPAVHLGYRLQ